MPLVTQINEKVALLNLKRNRWNSRGQTLWLYVNDHTPTAYDTLAAYAPTTVQGVGGQPVTWPSPAYDNGDGQARMAAPFVEFTPTGTAVQETVYGCYATDNTSMQLVYALRFSEPIPLFGATLLPITVVPFVNEGDMA